MAVSIRVRGRLRSLSAGNSSVAVEADSVGAAIDALDEKYPGFKARICDDQGRLRQFVNIYLNDEDVRFRSGLETAVGTNDTLSIIPAVAGGAGGR